MHRSWLLFPLLVGALLGNGFSSLYFFILRVRAGRGGIGEEHSRRNSQRNLGFRGYQLYYFYHPCTKLNTPKMSARVSHVLNICDAYHLSVVTAKDIVSNYSITGDRVSNISIATPTPDVS